MILIFIISYFISQVLGKPIVDGEKTYIQMHPWLASVQKHGLHNCGGSIISTNLILTAAHCTATYPLESLTIRVGSTKTDSGGSLHRVVAIKHHENYRESNDNIRIRNDLALIKVTPSFTFNENVTMIRLAEKDEVAAPGTVVGIAGWGKQSDKGNASLELRTTSLHIRNSVRCAVSYGDDSGLEMSSNNLICATEYGIPGFCFGDSGGPLITPTGRQVGIISWSFGCNIPHPGIYVDVARYRDWIDTNSRILELPNKPDQSFFSKIQNVLKYK